MTEDEALKKACCGPWAVNWAGRIDSVAAIQATQAQTCIASSCMAWRWSEEKRTAAYLQAVVEHMKATGDNFNKATQEVVKRREEFTHTEGFCGLAGAPS